MDAIIAFLNSETKGKEIYIELLDRYRGASNTIVLLLQALYRLK